MIIKLNLNGEYIGVFLDNTQMLPDGSLPVRGVCGICLNAEETHYLFVNDSTPNVIKVDLEGKNPTVFINNIGSSIPNGICLSLDRLNYYITLWSDNSIIKLNLDGTNITTFIDSNLRLQDGTQALVGPEAILQISPTEFLIGNFDSYNIILYNSQTLVCFLENSKILTSDGYKPIQELRKGDLVKTLNHGLVPIYMIAYKDICMSDISSHRTKDKLYVCSKEKYPEVFDDLIITGSHSILVDEFKDYQRDKTEKLLGSIYVTDGKYRLPACIYERTTLYKSTGMFKIWHFSLENEDYYSNYGIWANGLLVETCSKRYLKELSEMIPV